MDSISGIGLPGLTNQTESTQNQSQKSGKTPNGGQLGQDQFMMLLVTQLKNQDPLKPETNTEFISQLATFSSLEKLTSIESILKNSLGNGSSNPSMETKPV